MKKVLILEDEENIRSFVVINLQRAGYETLEAASGNEALELLKDNPDVDVAVLDIMLPDIDGFEVCRRIRANNKRILRRPAHKKSRTRAKKACFYSTYSQTFTVCSQIILGYLL